MLHIESAYSHVVINARTRPAKHRPWMIMSPVFQFIIVNCRDVLLDWSLEKVHIAFVSSVNQRPVCVHRQVLIKIYTVQKLLTYLVRRFCQLPEDPDKTEQTHTLIWTHIHAHVYIFLSMGSFLIGWIIYFLLINLWSWFELTLSHILKLSCASKADRIKSNFSFSPQCFQLLSIIIYSFIDNVHRFAYIF